MIGDFPAVSSSLPFSASRGVLVLLSRRNLCHILGWLRRWSGSGKGGGPPERVRAVAAQGRPPREGHWRAHWHLNVRPLTLLRLRFLLYFSPFLLLFIRSILSSFGVMGPSWCFFFPSCCLLLFVAFDRLRCFFSKLFLVIVFLLSLTWFPPIM